MRQEESEPGRSFTVASSWLHRASLLTAAMRLGAGWDGDGHSRVLHGLQLLLVAPNAVAASKARSWNQSRDKSRDGSVARGKGRGGFFPYLGVFDLGALASYLSWCLEAYPVPAASDTGGQQVEHRRSLCCGV